MRVVPRFAFLIHPLQPFHRRLIGARRLHAPMVLGGASGIDAVGPGALVRIPTLAGPVEALIVAVPDLADNLVTDQNRALALEIRAAHAAEAHGAQVIGLANVLAVVAGRGRSLEAHTRLPVTTGQAATAWACASITQQVLEKRGIPRGPVGILGFQGTVGDAVAAKLALQGVQVYVEAAGSATTKRAAVIGATPLPLDELLAKVRVVIGASTTGPILHPEALAENTTLVDLALPKTLFPGPLPAGFVRVPGEALRVPGEMHGGFWGRLWLAFAGYGANNLFACVAEPAAMAITGERGFSNGRRLDPERVEAIGASLLRLGFRPVMDETPGV